MCGIAGFVYQDKLREDPEPLISKMTKTLYLRGPDGQGVWVDPDSSLALGHRRLSIQDTSHAGTQPMHSNTNRYVITFNGEIYNFLQLKSELVALGYYFKGGSDTEVMLVAFEKWGVEASIRRFTGMFAFAVLDKKEKLIYLVRDRLGEKPLYYGFIGQDFVFASELKAFKVHSNWNPNVDKTALQAYLRFNQVPDPLCIYEGINKLSPGCYQRYDIEKKLLSGEPQRYWDITDVFVQGESSPLILNDDELLDEMDNRLSHVVKNQMISDVPLGAFLSGGIDSSLIVALMQKQSANPIKTFTIGFGEAEFNEAIHARKVAEHLGCDHTELYITPKEAMDVIPHLPKFYDEPFSDASQIPTYLVSKLAKTEVTVALSGDGGDEAFAGYSRYFSILNQWENRNQLKHQLLSYAPVKLSAEILAWLPKFKSQDKLLIEAKLEQLSKNAKQMNLTDLYEELTYISVLSDKLLSTGQSGRYIDNQNLSDPLHTMMLHDYKVYLPGDILTKVDRAAMACSLETRVPLLDHQWLDFVLKIPGYRNHQQGEGKALLKKLLYRYVPQKMIDRPKQGFAIPIGPWLRGELREWAEALLFDTQRYEAFDLKVVTAIWQTFLNGHDDNNMLIWRLLTFEAWHRAYHH